MKTPWFLPLLVSSKSKDGSKTCHCHRCWKSDIFSARSFVFLYPKVFGCSLILRSWSLHMLSVNTVLWKLKARGCEQIPLHGWTRVWDAQRWSDRRRFVGTRVILVVEARWGARWAGLSIGWWTLRFWDIWGRNDYSLIKTLNIFQVDVQSEYSRTQ